MMDYLDKKERQGVFFERPTERIHFPDPAELSCMKMDSVEPTANSDVSKYLTQAYAHKIREQNIATAQAQSALLRSSKEASMLMPRLTSAMLRDHYTKEIMLLRAGSNL